MNVTWLAYLVVSFIKHGIFGNLSRFYGIFRLFVKLAYGGLRSLVSLALGLALDICGDLLSLSLTLVSIFSIVVFISFIKSLKPKYNFHHDQNTPSFNDNQTENRSQAFKQQHKDIFSPSTRRLEERPTSSAWPIRRYVERKFPFALQLWSKLLNETNQLNQICSPALSGSDIELVYERISWSHTQADIESVDWINQTFRTLWPSIKTLLGVFVFNDLLKSKKAENKDLVDESKKLSKQRPKLSVYISSCRKLDLIRKIEEETSNHKPADRSLFRAAIHILKVTIIYVKQFIIDYVSYLFNRGEQREREKKFEINLERLLQTKKKLETIAARRGQKATKSWAGFDISTESRVRKEKAPKLKSVRKLKSAPARVAKPKLTHGLLGPRGQIKLRGRRLKLADRFKKAYEMTKEMDEPAIKRIRLGDSIPIINGIKHIDNERDDLIIDPVTAGRHVVDGKEGNLRFVSELSYDSDDKFLIQFSPHPLVGQVQLVKLNVQFRCYMTINHTVDELNRDLEIFDTPDDALKLFPAINYLQLALVDVPSFDWKLDRPAPLRERPILVKAGEKQQSLSWIERISDCISGLIDPLDIINHSYFKYMFHIIMHFGLKWFQPFNIRIGPYIYLKTIR